MSGETTGAEPTEPTADVSLEAEGESSRGEEQLTAEPTEGGEQEEQATQEEAKPEPEEDPRFAKQFQALARKERQLTERANQIKQAEQLFAKVQQYEKLLKTNPMKALEMFDVNLDHVLQDALGRPAEEKPDPYESRLKVLEDEVNAYKDAAKKHAEQQRQRANEEWALNEQKQIKELIDADATDKFELIKAHGEQDLVWDTIVEHYRQHQQMLSHEQAANIVEKYLFDRDQKALTAKKLQKKTVAKKAENKPESQTLTNDMRNSPPGTTQAILSEKERLEKAASLLKWD